MILETKERKLEIQIKTRTAAKFENMICGANESLLTKLPQMALGRNSIANMVEMLSFFQVGDKKLPKESEKNYDLYDFLDDYFADNETSIVDLYQLIVKEFDIRGIISRGLGFQLAKTIQDSVETMKTEMAKINTNQDTEI